MCRRKDPSGISIRIVLVQPRNPLNILAAARAARNFGLGDIAVVDVQPRAWAEALEKDVDRETPHGPRGSSRGWLGDARKYDTLMEAIGDCNWVLGTSSLERRRTEPEEVIDLRELPARIVSATTAALGQESELEGAGASEDTAARISDSVDPPLLARLGSIDRATLRKPNPKTSTPARSRIAILFGSEKRGLTNDHLMHCQNILWIPTVDVMPSMNLGQAVAVVCYELARSGVLGGEPDLARREGAGIVKPSAKLAKDSEASEDSPASKDSPASAEAPNAVYSKDSGSSDFAVATGASGTTRASELAEIAEVTKFSPAWTRSEVSELKGNKGTSKQAANAAERHALLEQIAALAGRSASSATAEAGTRHRSLCKLITRLPLTGDDVRLLLGVVKDARNASSASGKRPKKPRHS